MMKRIAILLTLATPILAYSETSLRGGEIDVDIQGHRELFFGSEWSWTNLLCK